MERFHLAAVFVIIVLTLPTPPCASQKEGFVSINCGGGNLTDPTTQIQWIEDPYNNKSNVQLYGSSSKVDSRFGNTTSVPTTLRYFPQAIKNRKFCYFFPIFSGKTYLIRASFLYGNYDKTNQPPSFFLIINYDIWTNVSTSLSPSPIIKELTFISKQNDLNICLSSSISTNQIPFISSLELRPLESLMYIQTQFPQADPTALSQGYGLQLWQRIHYGAKTEDVIRYPYDPFDRIWEGNTTGPTLSRNANNEQYYGSDPEKPPALVLASAITVEDPQANLSFTYEGPPGIPSAKLRVELHFEEVDKRALRKFDIAIPNSGAFLMKHLPTLTRVPDVNGPTFISIDQNMQLPLRITFYPIPSSSLGPLLNAIELFYWTDNPLFSIVTSPSDVAAIILIQKHFNLLGYGQGDPCIPKGYEWTWITCSNDAPAKITAINLSSLNLTGDIPPSINNLSGLQSIDLSYNMLNGSIPDMSKLNDLTFLDISSNNLCGRPPSFQIPITYNYTGNNGLCDEPRCDCNARSEKKSSTKTYILTICIMGALYVVILIIFGFISKATNNGKMKDNPNKTGADDLKGLPYFVRMFTYNEISTATHNFTTILGEGGFGKVYHGLLQTGEAIAVKSLADASKQGLKEFYNEVAILSRIRHKNLVSLLGCCIENTYMLVYEYVEKGNLKDLLYGDMESTEKPLSWTTRLQIALDASKGLEYLHTGCDPPIVHRDIKTSNILLGKKMQAKLADFGLSRLKEGDNQSQISTVNVVGTPGYLDPAYNATNQLTYQSDVYSFGIVLFEMICGRAPIDNFTNQPHIVAWATSFIIQGRVEDIVDPMLANGYKVDSLRKVVDIAMRCVEVDRLKRPKMRQVFQELQGVLEVEIKQDSLPSSKDISGSSSTSDERPSTTPYIKAIQAEIEPR